MMRGWDIRGWRRERWVRTPFGFEKCVLAEDLWELEIPELLLIPIFEPGSV